MVDERRYGAGTIVASLARFFRRHRTEILHTHRYKDTVLGTIAAKLAGVPKVVRTVHGLAEPMRGWERLKFQAYGTLDRAALGCCGDRIIAVSNDIANSLRNAGYRQSAIIPIHNAIDLSKARARRDSRSVRRDLGIHEGAPVIGTIGRLVPVKAHGDLLRAAQRILRQEPEARFLFVGRRFAQTRADCDGEPARCGTCVPLYRRSTGHIRSARSHGRVRVAVASRRRADGAASRP